ncbi:MAG: helix-turn-helix domain-containing protein, partial [Bacteroidales bacterium]
MIDNQTIKDRLKIFIKSLDIGQGAFEKQVGLSNGYVNNIRVSIQPDKLQKISLCYPLLNTGWLM